MLRRLIALLLIALTVFIWGCPKDDDEDKTPQHSITITSPNGGESWQVASSHAITWTSSDVSTVTVSYSVDGGANWIDAASGIANNNTYNWTVPNTPATTCKVKVADAGDAAVSDVSDANFTISAAASTDAASGSVRSDTSGVIETPAGARISVPVGAVPRTDQGNIGTMVFSIEKNNDIPVTPPTGETLISDVYLFGPEGFTFARPVEITVPVPEGVNPEAASLWRKNPNTGQAEFFSSSYDPATRTISAQTFRLSPWFVTGHNPDATVSGCIRVANLSHSSWLMVCVEQYTLLYPEQGDWMPESGSGPLFAPIGTIGWASTGNWYLPQGTFRLCLQRENETNPGQYEHIFMDNVVVHQPWRYTDPRCTEISNGSFTSPDTGRCACIPVPTTSVGTGDVQVTLTWNLAPPGVDLDLWVMDPDSEWCYWSNLTTASGGELDRDNWCVGYENGRPENIYWTQPPPTGQYIVVVDWYSTCGSEAVGSLSFSVRTVVRGTTQTFTQTIQENESMHEVTRFTISGGAITFEPPRGNISWANLPRSSKTR